MRFTFLPGLDGTGNLLRHFANRGTIVSYPPDEELTLDDYVSIAAKQIDDDTIVVAESFSGPVAMRQKRMRGLVLVGSFVTAPLPRVLSLLPLTMLARVQVPDWMLAHWMLSPYASRDNVRAVREAIGAVRPRVLASRMRIALAADERETLRRTRVPLLDLRGAHDRLVVTRQARRIAAARPDVVLQRIDGPHALLFTRPEQAWSVIASWSATMPAGASNAGQSP